MHAQNEILDSEEERCYGVTGKGVLKEKAAEGGGKVLWRFANASMTVFFVMAVGVQFNDIDPYLWVPLYGIAALLTCCITVHPILTREKWWRFIYWTHTVFCLGMFGYEFVQLIVVAVNPKSDGSLNPLMYEEGRELAGIMITVVWLFTCKQSPTIRSYIKFKKGSATGTLVLILSLLPLMLWGLCYSDVMSPSYFPMCGEFFRQHWSF